MSGQRPKPKSIPSSGTREWAADYQSIKHSLLNGPVIRYKLVNGIKTRILSS